MGISRSHFSLNRGLSISVAVHILPFAMLLLLARLGSVVPHPSGEALQLELFGMVTGQQVTGQQAMAAVEERLAQAAPPPEEAVAKEEPPQPVEQKNAPKPVVVHKPKKTPSTEPPRQASAAVRGQQAVEGRVQQTISARDQEASLMRQYVTELTRLVRNKLVYPLKAKAKGLTGVTYVAFTVSEGGGVVPGSESVRKSSGYEELDQAALNAVRSTAHLPNPPHPIEVVVAVDFLQSS